MGNNRKRKGGTSGEFSLLPRRSPIVSSQVAIRQVLQALRHCRGGSEISRDVAGMISHRILHSRVFPKVLGGGRDIALPCNVSVNQ
jgi:hypothetical protein